MTKYEILNKNQHGFGQSFSTRTALILCHKTLVNYVYRIGSVLLHYFAISARFSIVSITLFYWRTYTYTYGIKGNALNWVRSFLLRMEQSVSLNFASSNGVQTVVSWAKEGPVSFCLFVNELILVALLALSYNILKIILFSLFLHILISFDCLWCTLIDISH